MTAIDKNSQAMDQQALADHIASALQIVPPSGRELEITYQFIKRLFNPVVMGAENIPRQPCLFVGNHSLFALDGAVIGPVMQRELGRFPRVLGDRFLFTISKVGNFFLRRGTVMGHQQVCSALMEKGSDIMVFPGGTQEAVKPSSYMYSLMWKERYGFVKLAAMHGYTIVPFGIVGPDEFYGHAMEGHEVPDSLLGKLLTRFGVLNEDTRTETMPPVPVGTLGSLFPKPQRCYLGFGEALDLSGFAGKKLTKKNMQLIRTQVASEVEQQLREMLLVREQHKGKDSLLRRILTL